MKPSVGLSRFDIPPQIKALMACEQVAFKQPGYKFHSCCQLHAKPCNQALIDPVIPSFREIFMKNSISNYSLSRKQSIVISADPGPLAWSILLRSISMVLPKCLWYLRCTISYLCLIAFLVSGIGVASTSAATSSSASSVNTTSLAPRSPALVSSGTGQGSGTTLPDLFTGTMSHSIPIEVPPGRKGMDPGLSLDYRSNNGNGWVGVGWELEIGAIERSSQFGVSYTGDNYVLRIGGSTIDLTNVSTGEYSARIEGGFSRIRKLNAADGQPYWEITDNKGTRYLFGQTSDSRQDNRAKCSAFLCPRVIFGSPNQIFRWALDHVEDPHGNFMTVTYTKDRGQIYPEQIDYAGGASLSPTHSINFILESRTDTPTLYTSGFGVTTGYRLKTIEVFASGDRIRKYDLEYRNSARTARSILASVRQYGQDGLTQLPAQTLTWSQNLNLITQDWSTSPFQAIENRPDGHEAIIIGDFNTDGKVDVAHSRSG
ncbi:MAG: SpvB/TcaC N-terminal domain-containing protein [Blastocatellia bacterium]